MFCPGKTCFIKPEKRYCFSDSWNAEKYKALILKISALYFKICALCFFLHPMYVKTGLESVEFFEGSGV